MTKKKKDLVTDLKEWISSFDNQVKEVLTQEMIDNSSKIYDECKRCKYLVVPWNEWHDEKKRIKKDFYGRCKLNRIIHSDGSLYGYCYPCEKEYDRVKERCYGATKYYYSGPHNYVSKYDKI